jgi:hypothetical protein
VSAAKQGITEQSKALFVAYAKDAANWSGSPLVGGNVGGSKEDRGNLTQLKRAGLVTTWRHRHSEDIYLSFSDAGIALAASLGIKVHA